MASLGVGTGRPNTFSSLATCSLVEAGVLDQAVEVVVEVGIDELQGSPEQMCEQLVRYPDRNWRVFEAAAHGYP